MDIMHATVTEPSANTRQSRFLAACVGQPVDTTPIWLMRQAGRYMAEYRALREKYGILELIKTPELACEVTMQPILAFDLDAAIIFADILPPLESMGLSLSFGKGEGPIIHNPIRSQADVDALRTPIPEEGLWFTLEAIALARRELASRNLPLIGFSGAPFTLASYAIEGGGSHNYTLTKSFMTSEPVAWDHLMTKLSTMVGHYLLAQARAGAQALQFFDSWAGCLSPQDYERFVLPYNRRAIEIARQSGVPVINFSTGTSGMLPLLQQAGGDVIGIDWRIQLRTAWDILGSSVTLQGNLDPVALFYPWEELQERASALLAQASGHQGYIFNLGHGILPQTPTDNVARLIDFVHEYRLLQG
jgi:uroporphyrinogen decarboxylase